MSFLFDLFSLFSKGPVVEVLKLVLNFWFLWVPLALFFVAWEIWVVYVRSYYFSRFPWTFLEIRIPGEVEKSPRAMEIVFNSLHNTRTGNLIEAYWDGYITTWYSFEIASINGEVRFFIRAPKFFRNLVESQIYSQYPEVEIAEVDDYTKHLPKELPNDEFSVWGAEFGLVKKDCYPIKTYVDFKLDLPAEETEKTDPMSNIIEFLGSLRDGEQLWFQIVIQGATDDWKKTGEKLIEKMLGRKKFQLAAEKGEKAIPPLLAPGEKDVIEAVERNMSKLGFKTGIRFVYVARRDVYTPASFSSMLGIMKQFNSLNLNGFKPAWNTSIDYLFIKRRQAYRQRQIVENFRGRSYFYPPYGSFVQPGKSGDVPPFVFNSEELATIYHIPGRTAGAPRLERIEAKKGSPPANLPI